MTTLSVIIKHIIAILAMPHKIGDKIIRAQSILAKLTNNAIFPVAGWPANVVSLAQYGIDVTALVNAESAVKNRIGTSAARNAALATVMTDLRSLLYMVQLKADANLANAASIITAAGFAVKTAAIKQKQKNDALNTEVLGKVLLTAEGSGHHEWQMSKDKVAISSLPPTSVAHTFVSNLKTGDVWYFRNHKVNTPKITYNWSPWIELTVGSGGKNAGGKNNGGGLNTGSISAPVSE
jgi:hypothetical protein